MPVFPYFQIVDALIAHIGKQIQSQYNPRELGDAVLELVGNLDALKR